ncbi:MAG: hypothetical protein CVU56_00450 [Deltaproteobacteria bacterium HGW-Deltaproteobacteria-14]|jgi:hypothetical protein|nr:MAG: hypothetical protein CVU56_00450 [Deltaproteobacteria bacterium HGW-Deltaproteobacteria-14]
MRRSLALAAAVATAALLATTAHAAPAPVTHAASDPATPEVFAALDAVGPLDGREYDPRTVIRAVNALQPLGKDRGVAALRRYIAARPDADARGGLFVVLRTIMDPPKKSKAPPADACTAAQRDVAAGGCWRPPRLGQAVPAAPEDLLSLRFPAFVLGDVPLSLVSGYELGGLAERLVDHLSALAPLGIWRAAPLVPKSAGEIRYLFMHYGQWSWTDEVGRLVEAQLKRYESGPAPPCFDLGLVCAPRAAASEAVLRASVGVTGFTTFTTLEHAGKRLLFAALEWPTDSESYIAVLAWSYTGHFKEWRLVLYQEVYGAINVTPVVDPKRDAVVLKAADPKRPEALVLPLAHIPYAAND